MLLTASLQANLIRAETIPPVVPSTSLGDRVWNDLNGNGIQDDGEPGIDGAVVQLLDSAGNIIGAWTTVWGGYYTFTNLATGTYQVCVKPGTLPAGYVQTYDLDGVKTSHCAAVMVETGQTRTDVDFGYTFPQPKTASLGDQVWNDANNNGIQDFGEAGIESVTVNLYTCDGTYVAAASTGADGIYTFANLMPGEYYVRFVLPSGYVFSPLDQGVDDAFDSDADPATGRTICTSLVAGENDPTWDAGMYKMMMAPGTGTPGYWMNHPNAWPVDAIMIGGVEYPKPIAISIMMQPVAKDKTYTMFPALVAAKLNVLVGNDSSCIADTIAAADAWMALYGPAGSGVAAKSAAWKEGEPLYYRLDNYNNGYLCAPSRD